MAYLSSASLPLSGLCRRQPHEHALLNMDRRRTTPLLRQSSQQEAVGSGETVSAQSSLMQEMQNLSLQVSRQELQLQKFQTELACLQTELSGLCASTRSGALPGQVAALEKNTAKFTEAIEAMSKTQQKLQENLKHATLSAQEALETSIALPATLLRTVQALDERGNAVELQQGQRLWLRFPSSVQDGVVSLRCVRPKIQTEEIALQMLRVPVCDSEDTFVSFDDLSMDA
jgi:predicted RNase H-like nuclease (RuvC/YqgF family)